VRVDSRKLTDTRAERWPPVAVIALVAAVADWRRARAQTQARSAHAQLFYQEAGRQ
jgi:hypothetical protein